MKMIEVFGIMVVVSLVGVVVFQQYQISGLYGQNRELAVSNTQKDSDNNELMNQYDQLQRDSQNAYNQLNASYQQVLSNLEKTVEALSEKDVNFSFLQEEYLTLIQSLQHDNLNLTVSYNDLSQKYQDLKDVAIQLCSEYGATDGVFILDYKYSWGTVGMTSTYLANMTLYNALLTANVTVKVYGLKGTSRTFTYTIPSGTTVNKVEGWSGGVFAEDYDYITIDTVERNW
jgi:hypothetical protein